eukprot:GHVN01099745.1.p1 GENE.GHVN01099745.1~~GHVN01099745.1.p1  ORF type:complete len:110 (+),score=16.30 GHVN01099745.1:1414-1743(+)
MARWLIFSKSFSYTLKPTTPTWWQDKFAQSSTPSDWKRLSGVRMYLDKPYWTDEEQKRMSKTMPQLHDHFERWVVGCPSLTTKAQMNPISDQGEATLWETMPLNNRNRG